MKNPHHYLEVPRKDPVKKPWDTRVFEFGEIYLPYDQANAASQSTRCINCGIPYCKWKCSVMNHIPEWLKLVSQGNIIEAAELFNQTNTLPEICSHASRTRKPAGILLIASVYCSVFNFNAWAIFTQSGDSKKLSMF